MMTPTQDMRRTGHKAPDPLLKGLDARVNGVIGAYRRRAGVLRELQRDAAAVDSLAHRFQDLPDHALHERLMEYRRDFRRGFQYAGEPLVLEALAGLREAAHRKLGLRPFPVQLMGALALHRGYLAEMATGEGKTLTAGLAAVLAGWTRQPCHIITVNDYLVQRDMEWLRLLYQFCGVRVGCVTGMMNPLERQKGYGCDVTYTTSKELLADFLRDRIRLGALQNPTRRLIRRLLMPRHAALDGLVLRGLHTAIVDEADSVLIDEAVTPLIISAGMKNSLFAEAVGLARQVVANLSPGKDYIVNSRYKEIEITPTGLGKVAESCAELRGFWQGRARRSELIKQALVASEFFHLGKQYLIINDQVVIVDEFTGRQMPQRTWREGLHQAIEAKEGLEISNPSETVARLSFQRFFRCFHRLSGMTGTAREAAAEFWQVYQLPVISIPTNKPCLRQELPDRVFLCEPDKWNAIVDDIERIHGSGRPLLVGTRSVAASEHLAELLRERGLEHRVLNARLAKDEAVIIAQAGERGRITIATNMAGRGTDIILGTDVAERGGLHVIATERHESRRVDRQLFGRAARQGDPGSAQAYASSEDELIRRFLPRSVQATLRQSLQNHLPGRWRLAQAVFRMAQRRAQAQAFKQRRAVLKTDTWLEEALSFAGTAEV